MTSEEFFEQSMYFQPKEMGGNDNFSSPDKKGSYKQLRVELLELLEKARERAGVPMLITSGYRTFTHNQKVGGSGRSSHLGGYAVDISCKTSTFRKLILFALIEVGFTRIGIAKTFIHADIDPYKPPAVWLY